MALVVFLKGVNVGGRRSFRPAVLARELAGLDVVNIGAAGTFVVRRPVTRTGLRAELTRKLPFEAQIMICQGREILRLMTDCNFGDQPLRPEVVRFVSVLSRSPRSTPSIPVSFPAKGQWQVRILGREHRFVFGVYRRQMQAIACLGEIERQFGVPATTRNWNTMIAIAKALGKASA